MRVRTGVQLDEFGRPMRALYRDEEPGRGRTSALNGTPQYRGVLVVGRSGAKPSNEATRAAMAERYRVMKGTP